MKNFLTKRSIRLHYLPGFRIYSTYLGMRERFVCKPERKSVSHMTRLSSIQVYENM